MIIDAESHTLRARMILSIYISYITLRILAAAFMPLFETLDHSMRAASSYRRILGECREYRSL